MGTDMTRLTTILMAGLLAVCVAVAEPAFAKQPAPIEFSPMATRISDGNGGQDTLYMVILLQPRRAADVSHIMAHTKKIKSALVRRLRTVNSNQLIPPEGNTEWLEQELWTLVEKVISPVGLDGAFFRELSIE